jgi:glycosyltransferase involved in cell wall biosynthesis
MDGADVVFNPAGTSLPIKGLVPTVTTIHDLTPVVMPFYSKRIASLLKFQLRWAARFSTAIITVSECSRKDIVKICGVPESRIKVIYESHDRLLFNESPADLDLRKTLLARLAIEKPYVLHHGAIQPRKNLKRLIEAYRMMLLRNRNLDFDLVLAGPLAWQFEETVAVARNNAGSRGRVVVAGPLNDADLAVLIKGASLEVIPSLYEGFCLPLVEAMACGVPTIASNNSCLPEISGGVLRYFDPQSIEEMSACMEDVLEDPALMAELLTKGKARAQDFDWQRCAEETLAVLVRVARRKHGSESD